MGVSRSKLWIGGGAFVAVVILAATALLGYKPAMERAADLEEQKSLAEIQNAKLTGEVRKLRLLEADLPNIRTRIGELQKGIPTTARQDEFEAYVSKLVTDSEAFLIKFEGDVARVAVPAAANAPKDSPTSAPIATPGAAPEPGDASTATPNATAPPEMVAATIPTIPGLHIFEWKLRIGGTFEQVSPVLTALQTTSTRHFLVTALKLETVMRTTPATKGLPERKPGEVDYLITGYTYVLEGPAQPEDPKAGEPEPSPMPSTKDDPFADPFGTK